jgi:ubiquinone/menaquinone biosynthesis C-methylase UbiE
MRISLESYMQKAEPSKSRAAATYNSAADFYDDPANSFWERFGRKTVERLNLKPGSRILDVCCGSGASALPAAEIIGPSGFVLGVDLAEKLLELGRKKAAQRSLKNIEFRQGDILNLNFQNEFDVAVCVFGIFFVPEIELAVRELWRALAPGGELAITTWGPRFFEPATTAFWNSIREVRPDLYKGFNPWDRICDRISLLHLLNNSGIPKAEIFEEANMHPIDSPEGWWAAVLGSGYRGTIDQLNQQDLQTVRDKNFKYIHQSGMREVEANVVYAIASK